MMVPGVLQTTVPIGRSIHIFPSPRRATASSPLPVQSAQATCSASSRGAPPISGISAIVPCSLSGLMDSEPRSTASSPVLRETAARRAGASPKA